MKKINSKLIEEKIKLKKTKKQLAISIPILSLLCIVGIIFVIMPLMNPDIGSVMTSFIMLIVVLVLAIADFLCIQNAMLSKKIQKDLQAGNIFLVKDTVIEKRQFSNNLLYFEKSIATKAQVKFVQEWKTLKNDGFPVHTNTYKNVEIGDAFYLVYSGSKNQFLCLFPCKSYSAGDLKVYNAADAAVINGIHRTEERPEGYTLSKERMGKEKIQITQELILEHIEDVVHDPLVYASEKELREKYKKAVLAGKYEIVEDIIIDRGEGHPSNVEDINWTQSLYVATKLYPELNRSGIMIYGTKNHYRYQIDDGIYIVRSTNKDKHIITAFPAADYTL